MRREIRYALRALGRSPVFSLTIVAILGLAIGANTTVFAWMESILRNPFPAIHDGSNLVALNAANPDGSVEGMPPISHPTYEEWRSRVTGLSAIAAHAAVRLNLRTAPGALGEPVWSQIVSQNFFDLLGVAASRGRVFERDDESSRAPVVVLGHAYWQRRFGASEDAIGRTLLFNGAPLTVIGIAPPRFSGVVAGLAFDVWVPVWMQPSLLPGTDWLSDRRTRRLQAIGRLAPGVDLRQARDELARVAREVSASQGDVPPASGAIRYVRDTQLGSLMKPLSLAMLIVTALVLLTACANVATLLVARAVETERDSAIRLAIGASRARLAGQLVVQSGLLAAAGGLAGLFVASMTKDLLLLFVPQVALPVSLAIDVSPRVVAFAAGASLLTTALFGVLPAMRASRVSVVPALNGASGAGGGRSGRLRGALVVAQVAFCVTSLATAGLFIGSMLVARRTPLGFGEPREILLLSTDLTFTRLDAAGRATLVRQVLDRVRALPGVRAAALSTMVPLGFGGHAMVSTRVEGYTPARDESMLTERVVVTDGYFDTMQIPIARGRALSQADRAEGLRAAVVNEAFAARYWPGADPLGRRVDQGDGWVTVVGVARNSATQRLGEPPPPLAYHAYGQAVAAAMTLHVRAAGIDPKTLVEPVRRELARVHADLPVLDPGTLADRMAAATFVEQVGASVIGVLGVLALLIAGLGLYGAVASHVARRRREIALSVVLGATPRRIAWTVVGPGLRLSGIGLAIGTGLALAVSGIVRSQVTGLPAAGWVGLLAIHAIVLVVAAMALGAPAWRALGIDAVGALKER